MKMRNCPFCNAEVNADEPIYGIHFNKMIGQWLFNHNCGNRIPVEVDIVIYCDSKEEVVNRWNGEVETSESL